VYGPVPPVGFAVADPFVPPLQLTLLTAAVEERFPALLTETVCVVLIHPPPIVQVYVPAQRLLAVAALPPDGDQEYVYVPAGLGVTVAVPSQLLQLAGVDADATETMELPLGHTAHVVVCQYIPATHKLKQSPVELRLKLEVLCAAFTVVLTETKFHQFQVNGAFVPFIVREPTGI